MLDRLLPCTESLSAGGWIPGALCIGTRGHHGGKDVVAVRPGGPVVCIALRPTAPSSLIAVSARDDAEATARWLYRPAPKIDSSTCRRQAIPVPEETGHS
ncbi:hypothetical protein SAMN02787118_13090 [Streptomyces mirabilis]|uniref:Uncharacterized protein n=1 Tax=Streptomyces mirabilis TaxID=68239 RepID=A0A1I2VCL0_9ACTN|nr:hypothetical protein SAMN02787118_13090 [Streptomyces mirabilis]